jgi:hypothetical protein
MSVLARGMDLPTSCGTCHLRKSNEDRVWCPILGEYICFETEFFGRKTNCPLVEVPTPHGRLIDADALKTAFPTSENATNIKVSAVRRAINRMSTIIEAERKATE